MMGFQLSSFVFEILNFLGLLWLLSRFLYRPLKKGIEARRLAQEELAKSSAARLAAIARREEEIARQQREIAELRARVVRETAEDAAAQRARLLTEAKADAEAARAQGEQQLISERREIERAAADLAIEQSTQIAARLLGEVAPHAVDAALLEQLLHAIEAHTGATNATRRVELSFARTPAPAMMQRLGAALEKTLGGPIRLTTNENASLGAGAVAKLDDHVLDASLAGNLSVLAERARQLVATGAVSGASHVG